MRQLLLSTSRLKAAHHADHILRRERLTITTEHFLHRLITQLKHHHIYLSYNSSLAEWMVQYFSHKINFQIHSMVYRQTSRLGASQGILSTLDSTGYSRTGLTRRAVVIIRLKVHTQNHWGNCALKHLHVIASSWTTWYIFATYNSMIIQDTLNSVYTELGYNENTVIRKNFMFGSAFFLFSECVPWLKWTHFQCPMVFIISRIYCRYDLQQN